MARRVRRRRRVSHPARTREVEAARPELKLPEATPLTATRVLIVAPGPMRTILTSKISRSTAVMLAGVAEDEMTSVEKIVREETDVAAVYIHLGGELNGLDIARNVAKASPDSGILIIVDELAGVDVRRNARMFGVSWSYATAENAENGTRFTELVQSVGRGIHWIDPELKRVLEAIWQIASEGKDTEIESAVQQMSMSSGSTPGPLAPSDPAPGSSKGGIQTMRSGNSGIGKDFGISKTG